MWGNFPLIPEQASTIAESVDRLYYFLLVVGAFFSTLIFGLIFYFAIRYRRRSDTEIPKAIHGSTALEVFWSATPFCLVMVIFGWGASLYFKNSRAPEGAMTINVVGKQWMWKLQHPEGQREINELHVPIGRPIRLVMTSEDVIHSFYVPAFRTKMDVLPGRYTTAWFEATKTGEYHLFCAEYCGNEHSRMIGKVIVMEPVAYEGWLSGAVSGESLAAIGDRLFTELRCDSCHSPDGSGRGPSLEDVFGRIVVLASGASVVADETYIRESILNPRGKVVAGFRPVMPTFQGQIAEEQLLQLVAYIKSLSSTEGAVAKTNKRAAK
jgi:cytochrome c oxidase subunit 2